MARYNVYFNPSTQTAMIQTNGDVAPSAPYVSVGFFYHPAEVGAGKQDLVDTRPDNHVFYHHVQEILYKRKRADGSETFFPNGITDMSKVKILVDTDYIKLTAISSAPASKTLDLSDAETQQITNTFTPTNATNKAVTYASSDATKATVSSTGLITPVAVGTATITVTTADGGLTDTVEVTVVA